jgi:hypothetical protein
MQPTLLSFITSMVSSTLHLTSSDERLREVDGKGFEHRQARRIAIPLWIKRNSIGISSIQLRVIYMASQISVPLIFPSMMSFPY